MKKILDVTCGSRTIWFNKSHPAAVYCDKRQETHTNVWKNENGKADRECVIAPDVVCDFTDLPVEEMGYEGIMQVDLALLSAADYPVQFPGRENSRGANRELGFALGADKIVVTLEQLLTKEVTPS